MILFSFFPLFLLGGGGGVETGEEMGQRVVRLCVYVHACGCVYMCTCL